MWGCFLHLYQPPNQVEEIFNRVVSESYRPLINSLLDNPKIKITLNISASLTEQLVDRGFKDVIDGLSTASQRGQIEFTDSAKYHAFIPALPQGEVVRQIELNRATNRKLIGDSYNPIGFFPPEMAFNPDLVPLLESMGYQWIIIDEIAYNGKVNQVKTDRVYSIRGSRMMVYFRDRSLSNLIMSALVRREHDFQELLKGEYLQKKYFVTAMDGETFGHHRPGLQNLLLALLTSDDLGHVHLCELPSLFSQKEEVSLVTSTWASTEQDIENGVQFLTWNDPNNIIHQWQWELQRLALEAVKKIPLDVPGKEIIREKLDKALSSDHFFWASAKPWWSLEVIEAGAWNLLDVIQTTPGISSEIISRAQDLYHQTIAKAFEWQRTGYIRKLYSEYKGKPRVPFKDRTIGVGEPWIYDAYVEFMRREMKNAAEKENYEEAILWRDAIWKLETKNDVYDFVHAVDILRKKLSEGEILDTINKYRKQYEKVVSGQPEPRGT